MYVNFHYAARSDVGLVRHNNQDSAYAGSHLLVVADGMGGAAGGDIASSIVVGRLAALEGEAHGPDDALEELKNAIADAHSEILLRAENDPELSGLGTTCTAILRAGSTLAMAHIGDSRCYVLRDGDLEQVTTDHSLVQHLVDTGRLSPADAENHPKKSMLLRVLGDIDADVPVDISVREARPGDRLLLCSDGLSSVVSRSTIHQTLLEVADPGDCADALVELSIAAGAPDNVTCIVADVVDLDSLEGEPPSTVSQIVGASARDRNRPSKGSDTAAGRAARLGVPSPEAAVDTEDVDPGKRTWWERIRPWLLPVIALAIVSVAAWVAYAWTQTQYYVANHDGYVTVYQGVPANAGPISLGTVIEQTDIRVRNLTAYEIERVNGTIRATSLDEAWEVVDALRDDS